MKTSKMLKYINQKSLSNTYYFKLLINYYIISDQVGDNCINFFDLQDILAGCKKNRVSFVFSQIQKEII